MDPGRDQLLGKCLLNFGLLLEFIALNLTSSSVVGPHELFKDLIGPLLLADGCLLDRQPLLWSEELLVLVLLRE